MLDHKVHKDLVELQDKLDLLDPLEIWEMSELKDLLVIQDPQELKEYQDLKVSLELKDQLGPMVVLEDLEIWDPKDSQVMLVHKDLQDLLVPLEFPDLVDLWDHQDFVYWMHPLGQLDLKALLVMLDLLVFQDLKEDKVARDQPVLVDLLESWGLQV